MAMLPIMLILAPVAAFLGMAVVILILTISLIEGFAFAWIIIRIGKTKKPHWFRRPFAWSIITVCAFFAAIVLNVLLIDTCVKSEHNLLAVLSPLLISIPFSVFLAVRAGLSVARLIRESGSKGITVFHSFMRGLPCRMFTVIGIIFMMCALVLFISVISLAVTCSGDTGGIFMMICFAVFSVILVIAAISLWSATRKIQSIR